MAAAACGTDFQAPPAPPPPPPAVTWYQDAAPIVSKHCMSCHQAGGIAPFSLTDYTDAAEHAQDVLAQITSGTMPPFDAREEPDCTPRYGWVDDPRLSPAEIATMQQWVDDGTAAGAVAEVAVPTSPALTGVTMTLTPTQAFTASGDQDEFMCTILDPQVAAGAWLTGLQVRPGTADAVHHVVVGELEAGAATDALVAAHGIGVPWDCSTTANPASFVMNIWTPGNDPFEAPTGMAVPVTAGAKIVMQIHYHPAGTTHAPDATSIDLRTSAVWPQRMYFVGAVGNAAAAPELLPDPDDRVPGVPEFRIPANKADHEESMQFVLTDFGGATDIRVYSVNPHMHLLGTHIRGTIARAAPATGEPANECLANGLWNFDWQRTYIYDAPMDALPTIAVGDTVSVQCHWNNTFENPFEQRALADQGLGEPVDVGLGEGSSTDEMCLEIFGLSIPAPVTPTAVVPHATAPSWSRSRLRS
ncbi:MAG TPA: hypothetical protein VMJ10_27640 [Kofleriaceae bacterium]|nr:hypothetical protein [Kofleriaceae bacterium]